MNPVILTKDQLDALAQLRALAAANPVFVPDLMEAMKSPAGRRRHQNQMNTQSLHIPMDYYVTLSIETGQPAGTCRHMSMSSGRAGHVPTPEAVWMVAQELGFTGSLDDCKVWVEDIEDGREKAINIVQPVALAAAARD